MYINEINEIYKNKKQNIHIIIIFLLILIFICIWQKYESNESFFNPITTRINPTTTLAKKEQKIIYNLPTGMMIANIPESNRSYSTVFDDRNGNLFNKSTLNSLTCWAPAENNNNINQFVTLSLTNPTTVFGIVIMGRADFFFNYVNTFKVNYTTSASLNPIPVDNGIIYNSNLYKFNVADGIQKSYILFETSVLANSIMINPRSWNNSIAMRVDILVNFVPQTTEYKNLPVINSVISPPVVIPTIPLITGYISDNTDLSDSLVSSYNAIKTERNTNLDNQARIDKIDERVKKLKLNIIGITKSSSNNSDIKAPKFY
jgi:hypothetical protein